MSKSKLEDHIVEIEGVKYVPYEVAMKLAVENYNGAVEAFTEKFQDAMDEYSDALRKINFNVND